MSDLHVELHEMDSIILAESGDFFEFVNDSHLTGNSGLHFVAPDVELEGVLDEDSSSN